MVAEVLKVSSELFLGFMRSQASPASQEAVWQRSEELRQLNVNCRWSSIVVDERSPKETTPVDPYGRNRSPTDIVRAGERAPNAPGLVMLPTAEGAGTAQQTTSLFDIFKVSRHTVLIFSDETDKDERIVAVLKAYPAELLQIVFIHAEAAGGASASDAAHLSVLDRDGHAHAGYHVQKSNLTVIIVRPDGVVGGIIFSGGGAKRYFDGVFSAMGKPQVRGSL